MSINSQPPCRLFMIMARQAKTAVIFRRGPSKWTQLIKWDTKTDNFEYGPWFKGRIYEKRCDLSPDDKFLIYFASKFNQKTVSDSEYTYAWSATSKPPWLTALALWPKGDCWHGEGLFSNNKSVMLNHRPHAAANHPKHAPPRWLKIQSNPDASGEDDPLYSNRLTRDGWKIRQDWHIEHTQRDGYITHQPEVRIFRNPKNPLVLVMNRHLAKYTYYETYEIENLTTGITIKLEAEYARWDQRGRLAITHEGKLQLGFIGENSELLIKEIANFNENKPEEVISPSWAKKW